MPIPDDLITANAKVVAAKVALFSEAGPSGIHAVFDFDRTLTVSRTGAGADVTTWQIVRDYLPAEAQAKCGELFEKYRPLELAGKMTEQDAVDWWSAVLDLYVQYHLDLTVIEKEFLARAIIRPGALELCKLLADKGIPLVILSAGIREIIEIWCRQYQIKPALIIATSLELDADSKLTGWHKETLVHSLNKSEASHPELHNIRTSRPRALLVGDGLDDASMAVGERDVLRVRILDPRPDEVPDAAEDERTFARFDGLIRTGTLAPIVTLVKQIAG